MGYVKEFLINIVYYLIGYTSLVLYVLGIVGLCLCVYLLFTKFNKKNKLASIFTLLIICLSLTLLVSGTVLSLNEKKSTTNKNKDSTATQQSQIKTTSVKKDQTSETSNTTVETISTTSTKNTTPPESIKSELTLEYNSNDFQCPISLINNTAQTFTGSVSVDLLDSSKSSISKLTIPISNFIQTSTPDTNVQVTSVTSDLKCTYSGKFSTLVDSSIGYSITSISLGSGYLSFDVSANDVSLESLKHICETFKSTYNKNLCKGFTIYFVNYQNGITKNIYAEYFCNNVLSDDSNLLIYSDNSKHTI